MNKYQFTFLVTEEAQAKDVKEVLSGFETKITKEEKWGKRDLAYSIDKNNAAYYFSWDVEIAPKEVTALKTKLNFSGKMLRYLLLKID
ncbi:30S ribosomal protein S6 [Candidatus Roizmanbacteria bacterium]|nr:30S ribosomal protein S6 [Candidatus Roizmanbacteria bacterium]